MSATPPSAPSPAPVPVWLDRLASLGWRILATAALGFVVAQIAIQLSSVVASILLALVVAAPLVPTVAGLRARGRSRTVASAIACLVGLVVLLGVAVLLVLALLPSVAELLRAVSRGVQDVSDALVSAGAPGFVIDAFDRVIEASRQAAAVNLAALAGTAVSVGTVLVLAGFLTFFVLQDGDRGWAWMMHQVRPWQAEALTPSATLGLHRVSGFVRRTGVLAALDAGAAAALLVLVGAPLVGPMVAVVFLAGFVPYLGAILAATIVGLATLALVGPAAAIVVVVGLGVAALMEDRLLRGTSIGRGAGIRPLVVLVVIPAGGAMFGLLGLVTVLPVTVFVLAIYRTVIGVLDLPEEAAGAARPPAGDDGAWRIPVWLDRLGQWSWRGLVAVGLLVLGVRVLVVLPIVVVPVVLAVVIAATLLPLMTRLRAAGVSRGAAAAVTTLGVTVGIAVIVIVTLAWISEPMQEVAGTAQAGAASIDAGWLASAEGELMGALTFDLGEILHSLFEVGLAAVLVVLLTFFFLMDGSRIWEAFTEPVHGARRQHLDEAGERSVGILSGYMVGTALVSLFGAVTGAIIMWLLGLPLVIPIAVLTFFGGFIPYIGSFITTALAFLVAVAVGTTADIVIMAAYTLVFNLVQGSFVAPIVYGRALSLHPGIVLLAVPVGSAVAGILGMFLVVPVVAIVSATWRLVVATIEDDQPAPTDDAHGSDDGGAPVVPARAPGPAVPDPT